MSTSSDSSDEPEPYSIGTYKDYTLSVELSKLKQTNNFQRVIDNTKVTYGDGGEADLKFDVEVCPRLLLPPPRKKEQEPSTKQEKEEDARRAELVVDMRRVAEWRKDIQQNAVVDDIVDPDLFPRLIPLRERVAAPAIRIGETRRAALQNHPVRGGYTWIPSVVRWTPSTSEASFASPINNLPRTSGNAALYKALEGLLSNMMPAMIKYSDGSAPQRPTDKESNPAANPPCEFYNVAVKMQRYRLPPGSMYTGQWHTEGVTEGVRGVGVYYAEWPQELTGGALKFRPPSLPDDNYREYVRGPNMAMPTADNAVMDVIIPLQEGSAVVFSNEQPHRFCTIANPTPQVLYRSFVNFFMVDPSLPATDVVPTNADVYLALIAKLNYDVIGDILEFLGLTPTTFRDAKRIRELAKAEMVGNKGKWGVIHYGNCGNLEWMATGRVKANESKFPKQDSDDDEETSGEGDDEDNETKAKKNVPFWKAKNGDDLVIIANSHKRRWMHEEVGSVGKTSAAETLPEGN